MNKTLARRLLAKEGVKTPYFRLIRSEEAAHLDELATNLYRAFPQPCVIKPAAKGSSVGVSLARSPAEISYALSLAFRDSDAALIEEYLDGVEVVVGIIEDFRGERLYRLLPIEVVLSEGAPFYDYEERSGGRARFTAPATMSSESREELSAIAERIHRVLGLRHYSSSDFIVHPKRGIYFLEVDSLPSFAPRAPFPAALHSVGASLPQFLEHLISLAQKGR